MRGGGLEQRGLKPSIDNSPSRYYGALGEWTGQFHQSLALEGTAKKGLVLCSVAACTDSDFSINSYYTR